MDNENVPQSVATKDFINSEEILLASEANDAGVRIEEEAASIENFILTGDPNESIEAEYLLPEEDILSHDAVNVNADDSKQSNEDIVKNSSETENENEETAENIGNITNGEQDISDKNHDEISTENESVAEANADTDDKTLEGDIAEPKSIETDAAASNTLPASAGDNKENTVDENQCRVCTTKENLVSLFKKIESQTIAEMLMTICPTVVIAPKDFMPQFICNTCYDNVTIALQLKMQCETTERELRKKLSRSKNKKRRSISYVIIDAPIESDPASENDEDPADDDEFVVSEIPSSTSEDEFSVSSDASDEKKKPGKRGRKPGKKLSSGGQGIGVKRKNPKSSGEPGAGSSSDEQSPTNSKNKRHKHDEVERYYPCDACNQVFTKKLSLALHSKTHSEDRKPIKCEICGRVFKIQGAYKTHLERHKVGNEGNKCSECNLSFTYKSDLRRHMTEEHDEGEMLFTCKKCKRNFVTEARLQRHCDGQCPGTDVKTKKSDCDGFVIGKDLFKSVAPPTTTYWSDSFSD